MKKILGLTSVALLGVLALTGCSCSKNGTYEFSHIEYKVGEETKTTDCKNTEGLDSMVVMACSMAEEFPKFVIDGNKMYPEDDADEVAYIKIEGEKILMSETEDGEYIDTEMYTYKDGKIYMGMTDDLQIVFKK